MRSEKVSFKEKNVILNEPVVSKVSFLNIGSCEEIPGWTGVASIAEFLNSVMRPYEDRVEDITRGLEYALSTEAGKGGFVVLAVVEGCPIGALVMLKTGMGGYVPENLLLFVGVAPEHRGQGVGKALIDAALRSCVGQVKLHVEPENPARRLYGRLGFREKYIEMRAGAR